jgi:hypothetical protein
MRLSGGTIEPSIVAVHYYGSAAPVAVAVRGIVETIVHQVILKRGSARVARSFAIAPGHYRAV